MRKYIVETEDGKWRVRTSTPFLDLIHRSHVKNGTVTLDGKVYTLDPRKMRRLPYRPKRFLWLVVDEAQVQLWKEDDPEPVDLFGHEPRKDDRTATKIGTLARAERLARVLSPKMNMMTILLLFSVIGNVFLALSIFYLQGGF